MQAIDRAIQTVEETGERRWEAEINRLKGDLLAADGHDRAEHFYTRALETARDQRARWIRSSPE